MELCVFQGTFNPIHNAHLRVAEYVLNKYGFDLSVRAEELPIDVFVDISNNL